MKTITSWMIAIAATGCLVYAYLSNRLPADGHAPSRAADTSLAAAPRFVGMKQCAGCHQDEASAWQGSDHQLAMQQADDRSVLGDFKNAHFEYNGVKSTFFRKQGRYYVNTDGPDGTLSDFEILYTFGVRPLQQYLVKLDQGRLQALGIAWDSRPKQAGGQRWFHLNPADKIDYRDELHWTKLSHNWNFMCAECHSTDLKKNYDPNTGEFHTTWSEINVSCEACHGPGSRHVAWANKKPGWENSVDKGLLLLLDERRGVSWQFDGQQAIARRSVARRTSKEIETCARCHSRRSTLTADYRYGRPLMDTHLPALLTEPLYYPDGQIREEDYVYGSFVQSKMFRAGVTCSDCHEPHKLKLRAPGNGTCLQCHRADTYDTVKHHHHAVGGPGASCAECHMPPSNFMVIDARHDHSIRIPRPDLSITLRTPNACNQCHSDKTPLWARNKIRQWYGKSQAPARHFGAALFAAQQGQPDAGPGLMAVASSPQEADIVRATATSLLPDYLNQATFAMLPGLLSDPSPMVRRAALSSIDRLPAQHRWPLAGALLRDPVLGVRIEAARVLAMVSRDSLTAMQKQNLDMALKEYIRSENVNAELPQSHVNLGLLYLRLGRISQAETEYRQALKLDPAYAAAYVNLADLYREQQQEDRAGATLMKARSLIPRNADIEHGLGLHFVRTKQMPEALQALGNAARWLPRNARYGYVYAVALQGAGQTEKAIEVLRNVNAQHPYDRDVLIALVSYAQKQGDSKTARIYAEKLVAMDPALTSVQQVLRQLSPQRD